MTPLEKLTAEDKHLIQAYIRSYGEGSENNETEMIKTEKERMPIDYLLRIWNNQKSYFLNKIFGDNLIIKRPIEYAAPYEDHRDELRQLLQHSVCEKIWQRGCNYKEYPKYLWKDNCEVINLENYINFYNARGELTNPYESFKVEKAGIYNKFIDLTNSESDVWDNIYSGKTFSIQLFDKKLLKIPHGIKWIKAIIKVARYLDIDEELIEDLRQQHSMCTNTKILKGNICFSIHPLDYMTMSDANFSSCMNWMNKGAYRRGTVEMMNSQSVVVVYLESEHEKLEFWDGIDCTTAYWNMKKWRTLLMVAPNHITSIKSYPYECGELSVIAVNIMTQLVEQKYNEIIYNSEISEFDTSYWGWNDESGECYKIQFGTDGAMYCDMGCTTHFMIRSNLFNYNTSTYFNYCGPTECMFCGEICSSDNYSDESVLYCRDCQSSFDDEDICYCAECGRRLWIDDAYWSEYVNDYYCPDCFDKNLIQCTICGDNVPIYHSTPIILSYKGFVTKKTKWNIANLVNNNERSLPSEFGVCEDCSWRMKKFLTGGNWYEPSGWRHSMIGNWIEETKCSSKNFEFKSADNEEYIELSYDENDSEKPTYLYRAFDIWNEADARKVWNYQEKWREEEDPA